MHPLLMLFCLALVISAGCTPVDSALAPRLDTAVSEPATTVVSDQEYSEFARTLRARSGHKITTAPVSNRYARRLARLMDQHKAEDGGDFTFTVCVTRRVLAYAMPAGDIYISVGFMSMLTDNELRFIMAHLMGHVRNGDALAALRIQYTLLNSKKAPFELSVAEQDKLLATLEDNQYTVEQENLADDYACAFMQRNGYDLLAIVSVLQKVGRLEKKSKFSVSHAEPTARARRMVDRVAFAKREQH